MGTSSDAPSRVCVWAWLPPVASVRCLLDVLPLASADDPYIPMPNVCVWLGIWASVRVVAPTVPERLAEGPASYVSRRIRTSV